MLQRAFQKAVKSIGTGEGAEHIHQWKVQMKITGPHSTPPPGISKTELLRTRRGSTHAGLVD